jgi:uncharacterized protein
LQKTFGIYGCPGFFAARSLVSFLAGNSHRESPNQAALSSQSIDFREVRVEWAMASAELRKLWNLHLIDAALLEVRKRAAALDPGRSFAAEIKRLEDELAEKGGPARALSAELTDLEVANKGLDDKIKRIEKELYGGKIVNPREVENFEKEIAGLKRQRGVNDERILELWELVPPAKKTAEAIEAKIAEAKKGLAQHQQNVLKLKAQLEQEFRERSASRPEAAKEIDRALLARYEGIRQKHAGTGMAEVVKGTSCGGCGTMLPERTLQAAREGRAVTCETCHRILYLTEGVL